MSHLHAPKPDPPLQRVPESELEWTKRERQTEVCRMCYVQGL